MNALNLGVIIKLEPDFSEGSVSYNSDGTLNRAETKNTLGPHSGIAAQAAFYAKVKYGAKKPSFIPWKLNLNPRTKLNYSVDLIIGKKT